MDDWSSPLSPAELTGADFDVPGVVFAGGEHLYRTTGERVGHGGMGHAYHLDMRRVDDPTPLRAVGKIYRWEYLVQLRQDATARRFFDHGQLVLSRLRAVRDVHLLPVLLAEPIADNHLVVTPYAGEALVSLVLGQQLSPPERVQLLLGAVRGLRRMHELGLCHGDFTLRNVLVHQREQKRNALLFDFDLSLALDEIGEQSYAQYYAGRIVGAPEYSLTPEQLDPVLEAQPMSPRRDFYAVGTALYGLFTDESVYGEVDDLPSLLEAIGDGVVNQGKSRVPYPDDVPGPLREVIDTCLERDPKHRYPDAEALVRALERAQSSVTAAQSAGRFRTTLGYVQVERRTRLRDVFDQRPDQSVPFELIQEMQAVLARHGYVLERSLGRVKGHPIFLAAPDPTLVATGRFPAANAYRKIVTAIDVRGRADADDYLATWLGRIVPTLQDVRSQGLTALHQAVHDRPAGLLLLFSEYLENVRFGTDLARHRLTLEEALGLGLIIGAQIGRLHTHGLAHNNVTLKSLLFKHLPETGQVKPIFVGLVEPSYDPEALIEDVRRLAGVLLALVHRSRVNEAAPEHRPRLQELLEFLQSLERGEGHAPTIGQLVDVVEQSLALVDGNFAVVRRGGGDPLAYAHLITRHSLYRYLWASGAAAPVAARNSGQSGSQP